MFNERETKELKLSIFFGTIAGVLAVANYISYSKLKKIKEKLKKDGIKSVEETLTEIEKKKFEKFKKVNSNYIKKTFFIEGRLSSKNLLNEIYSNPDLNTLKYIKIKDTQYKNNKKIKEIISSGESSLIFLKDFENEQLKINFPRKENSILENIMEVKKIEKSSGIFQSFFDAWNFFIDVLFLTPNLTNLKFFTYDKIYGISLNTPVFMYSTVYINLQNNSFFIEPNLFISKCVKDLANQIDREIFNSAARCLFTSLVALCFFNIVRKITKRYLEKKLHRFNMMIETKKIESISGSLQDTHRCIVCMDLVRNVILLPCNHICMCHICHEDMNEYRMKICPICKKNINKSVIISYN